MLVERLGLQHQEKFCRLIEPLQLPFSEYSFANAFLFRSIHTHQFAQGEQSYLLGTMRDGIRYAMPLHHVEMSSQRDLHQLSEMKIDCLYPIAHQHVAYFRHDYVKSYWEGDSDYCIQAKRLASYPGRALSAKKNLLMQFLRQYEPFSMSLSPENASSALQLLDRWIVMKGEPIADSSECSEAIWLFNRLQGLEGRIYFVEGQPVGLIIGQTLLPDVHVILFTKCDHHYKGIYQYVYSDYASRLKNELMLVNMQQDLGVAALRQSKHSYHPDTMLLKWRLFLYGNKLITNHLF